MQRLVTELQERDGDGKTTADWAELAGIDMDAINSMCAMSVALVNDYIGDQVREGVERLREQGELEEGFQMGFGKIDIGQAIADACLSMFIFGWESHAQYGKER